MPAGLHAEDVVVTGKRSSLAPWMDERTEEDERRARELLIRFGCEHLLGRALSTASQGERQRVLLARAAYGDPELLLMDEPCAGLDLPGREDVIAAIDAAPSTTLVLATHHLEEIPASATHAALLRAGRLVAAGPIADVLVPEAMGACFGIDVEVRREHGRWSGVAVR
jgi:iron complex transport system ATP-binding protein